MPAEYLPGFGWDPQTHRYRNLDTGRFVSRQRVLRLLDDAIGEKERKLANLTQQVIDGQVSPSVWQAQVRQELRRLYLQNRSLGAGGWDRLTQRDFGRIGGRLNNEYRYLSRFAEQIANGEVTPAQALNRLHMYLGNARREAFLADRERAKPSQPDRVFIERRTLGVAEHCQDCVRYYEQGWQPMGALPVPSEESVCDGNCRCSLMRREVAVSELHDWIGTKRWR